MIKGKPEMLPFIAIVFFIFLLLGTPIGFALGIAALAVFIKMDTPVLLNMVPQRYFAGLDMFTLMAMPFFILAGEMMNKAGITHRLVQFANIIVGHLRGGLAHANIVASIFFAGLTGAAVSDTAAIGTMLIPAMVEDGYELDYSAAVTASSSIIGPTIPPSNMMVIYGSLMNVSIAGLFASGILTGLLLAFLLMILAGYYAAKRNYPKKPRSSLLTMLKTTKEAIIPLLMPVIILGGILTGVFTPTEAAAVAVGYAAFVGLFVLKTLKLKDFPELFYKTAVVTGVVFLIIGTANICGWILAAERVPEAVAKVMLSIAHGKNSLLLLILILMLIVGCFMDIAAALIILGPILHPLAVSNGVHPLHFGIIMVFSLNVALITPPVGACLFVACGITKLTLEQLSKAIWPFIIVEIITLFIITFVPWIPMAIPKLLGFY
jgi:tripartite ATP-independent transporter DctM subunit